MAKYYYHGWTETEEKVLTDIMNSGPSSRKKIEELFLEAAETLQRTVNACRNRWYEIRPHHTSKFNNRAV